MNLLADTTNAQVDTERLTLLFKAANGLIFGLQSVAVVWFGAVLVLGGQFTIGMLFAFVAYQEQFKARITTLVDRLYDFRMLSLQVQRLADVVLEKPESTYLESTGAEVEDARHDAAVHRRLRARVGLGLRRRLRAPDLRARDGSRGGAPA